MKERARKLMEKRESMINELLEALEILGYQVNGAITNSQPVVINKGKVVRVVEVKERIVKESDDVKVKELEAENHALKEMNNTLEDRLKEMEKAYDQLVKDLNNRCERIETLKEEINKLNETKKAIEDTKQYENAYCGECMECTDQEVMKNTNELKCTQCGQLWERFVDEEQPEEEPKTKKGADKVVKKQPKQKNFNTKGMIKCGENTGDDCVLFISKDVTGKKYYGQIRIDNYVRNFYWSCTSRYALVYGVTSKDSLVRATELIKMQVPKEERNKRDIEETHPVLPQWPGRYYYNELANDSFIYITTDNGYEEAEDNTIIYKGYYNNHAFVVRKDGEVFWRHYNYVFMKKPYEKTPSKGYDLNEMINGVSELIDKAVTHFERTEAAHAAKENKAKAKDIKSNTKDSKNTKDNADNSAADARDYSALL